VVVSPSGTVMILAWRSLRVLAVLRDFRSPQIAVITPDGDWAYVTDSASGDLSVISLASRRVVDRVFVGYGAHHLAVSPDGNDPDADPGWTNALGCPGGVPRLVTVHTGAATTAANAATTFMHTS
jgi:YVTN family beta-propeller protein